MPLKIKPQVLILGNGRHGKDTVAEMIQKVHGMSFTSSSEMAAKLFLYDLLKDKYGYKSFHECYKDRHNHREEWKEAICEYNREDPARLARQIYAEYDMYVGMRDTREINECRRIGLYDLIVWVHDPREAFESKLSFNIDRDMIGDHITIVNDGTLDQLRVKVNQLCRLIACYR